MSENGIIPSMDEIMSAVNDELDESISVEPISEEAAQNENKIINNATAGVDLFNASMWYLQDYPIVVKQVLNHIDNSKPVVASTDNKQDTKQDTIKLLFENPENKAKIKKAVIAIVIIAILILGIIYLPYLIESTPFEVQTMQDASYYTSEQIKKSIEDGFTTRNVVNMYGSPDSRYFGSINSHFMIYYTSDGELDIRFDNNGYIIDSETYTW